MDNPKELAHFLKALLRAWFFLSYSFQMYFSQLFPRPSSTEMVNRSWSIDPHGNLELACRRAKLYPGRLERKSVYVLLFWKLHVPWVFPGLRTYLPIWRHSFVVHGSFFHSCAQASCVIDSQRPLWYLNATAFCFLYCICLNPCIINHSRIVPALLPPYDKHHIRQRTPWYISSGCWDRVPFLGTVKDQVRERTHQG